MTGYPDIAVIMISALSNSDIAIACMRQGAYDYIIKPFNMHEVVLRIGHALEKRNLRIDNRAYQLNLEKKVEEQTGKLRASEENFRNSLDNSPMGIRIVTAAGQAMYANRALLEIYGYSSAEEMDSVPYQDRHTPETFTAHQERVRKRKMGEPTSSSYEIDIVRKMAIFAGCWLIADKYSGTERVNSKCCVKTSRKGFKSKSLCNRATTSSIKPWMRLFRW